MIINGEKKDFPNGINVERLLEELNIDKDRIVVEVDLEIISKDDFETKKLSTESKVEIIRFVGGG
ncbi:sulfur carrier protein [Clostridium acidisoli DSM 12555]|uniref:Sulfur carrier protein n=1 Tax=Clostridium acidisoli DSM 12555 TaxID=1121291 RepID=A0A1W1XFW7_9CLOT|nr:sulfur carrier protein ThiS [Clostridium acidisoli]SMC22674.1 sulfur carrier protein [Clostridium acidisoli DSM 12555]